MILDKKQLDTLLINSNIILSDSLGPKVIKLANGQYLKIFRLKKWLSTGLFKHYADRFYANAKRLKSLGITTIEVDKVYTLPTEYIDGSKSTKAVLYDYLPGVTLRDYLNQNNLDKSQAEVLVLELEKFINKLHNNGVLFRAIHFGNILYNPDFDDKFGLIDVDNTKFYNRPLSQNQIKRNLKHLTVYNQDRSWLQSLNSCFISDLM